MSDGIELRPMLGSLVLTEDEIQEQQHAKAVGTLGPLVSGELEQRTGTLTTDPNKPKRTRTPKPKAPPAGATPPDGTPSDSTPTTEPDGEDVVTGLGELEDDEDLDEDDEDLPPLIPNL